MVRVQLDMTAELSLVKAEPAEDYRERSVGTDRRGDGLSGLGRGRAQRPHAGR